MVFSDSSGLSSCLLDRALDLYDHKKNPAKTIRAKPTTPPTTPPAIAPAWFFEGLSKVDGPGDVLLVDEELACALLAVVALWENISCSEVKFQPPTGSVRFAFPDALDVSQRLTIKN